MSRFEPEADKPYGSCKDCDTTVATREEMTAHFRESMANGSSHTVSVTNPSRRERIARALNDLVNEAISDFVDDAMVLVDREGVTEDEITAAIRSVTTDFADGWENRGD